MADLRLGDVIDDWCVKCRRLTNHSVVSIVDGAVAKVRCRTCYHDHDYRHEEPPPSKKDLKKQALFDEVLATIHPGGEAQTDDGAVTQPSETADAPAANDDEAKPETSEAPKKKSRKARNV
ncbi:MAG TPA: hypothetical protein VFA04_20130 [Bryobacteraceae bacterium]|nr:hypothetical protein [Bryobacteraceae bacterium]